MIEYVVTVGNFTRSFHDYDAAREWFGANFMFGLAWSFQKFINGKLVASL